MALLAVIVAVTAATCFVYAAVPRTHPIWPRVDKIALGLLLFLVAFILQTAIVGGWRWTWQW